MEGMLVNVKTRTESSIVSEEDDFDEWYFNTYSEEYGWVEYGPYDNVERLELGKGIIMNKAAEMDDGVLRTFTPPYQYSVKDERCKWHHSLE